MADRDIVKVRLSGTGISKLADRIAALYGWTVLDRSAPRRNRRNPGERVCMTVRYGYPPVSDITAWLAANGWKPRVSGTAGTLWTGARSVGVPHDDSDPEFTRGALERIAAAEGISLGELVAMIDAQATTRKDPA